MSYPTPLDPYHVYPAQDPVKHKTGVNDYECWCDPLIKEEYPPYVVVHRDSRKILSEPIKWRMGLA